MLAGIGYHLNDYYDIVDPKAEQGLPSPMVDYNDGRIVTRMFSSGLSLNMVFGSRDSPIYLHADTTSQAASAFPTWLGSDTEWQSFQADFRTYTCLAPHGVRRVGDHLFTFGTPPYLELPAIGWDTYQRQGLPQGRVRARTRFTWRSTA